MSTNNNKNNQNPIKNTVTVMSNIRVIIAEDDPQIAEIQKRFIERVEGFELVGLAHGLEDARDLAEILKPDLLLLDVQFPTGTGLELLKDIRNEGNTVDVILITAAKEVSTLKEAMLFGVFDYILKPLVFERLKETLEKYQQHKARLDSMQSLAQQDVDSLMPRSSNANGNNAAPVTNRLPKGIDGLTLTKIRTTLAAHPTDISAEETAQAMGASRATARRYLEYLVSTGEMSAEIQYGTVGRPERRYKVVAFQTN